MVSRKVLAPSPNVILQTASITVTSPTCRVESFTLTGSASLESPLSLGLAGLSQVLHHLDFSALGFDVLDLHVIHECLDQQQTAAGLPEKVLLRQRIRERLQVKPLTLVPDHH